MDPLVISAAAAFVVVLSFLAGAALMGAVLRRAMEARIAALRRELEAERRAERQAVRECLDRGNRLVQTGEDVLRKARAVL